MRAVSNDVHDVANPHSTSTCADSSYAKIVGPQEVFSRIDAWCDWLGKPDRISRDPRMLPLLGRAFRHDVYGIEQWEDGQLTAILPLVFMNTRLFGRVLVSLPYVNESGVVASPDHSGDFDPIISQAINLAEQLDVKYLQLRHQVGIRHHGLNFSLQSKVKHEPFACRARKINSGMT